MKLRELGVDLELNACSQEGKALEQALDVGVGALESVEPEAACNLGIVTRELAAEIAQVA